MKNNLEANLNNPEANPAEQGELVELGLEDALEGEAGSLEANQQELQDAINQEGVSPSLREKLQNALDTLKDLVIPFRKADREKKEAKDNQWKQDNWENPDKPEAINNGLFNFNRHGLSVEYADGTKIDAKLDGDLLKFHKKYYGASYNDDIRFGGHFKISADDKTEVIELSYPHKVPEGGDFQAFSSTIKATVDKLNKTVTFEKAKGRLTS